MDRPVREQKPLVIDASELSQKSVVPYSPPVPSPMLERQPDGVEATEPAASVKTKGAVSQSSGFQDSDPETYARRGHARSGPYARLVRRAALTMAVGLTCLWGVASVWRGATMNVITSLTLPRYSPILERAAVVDAAVSLRTPVDPGLSEAEAGQIYHRLSSGRYLAEHPEETLKPIAPHLNSFGPLPVFERNANEPLQNPQAEALRQEGAKKVKDLHQSLLGVTQNRTLADGTDLLSRLATAQSADITGARYNFAAMKDMTLEVWPYARFGPLKEMAYAQLARIAWAIEDKDYGEAERLSKELYSFGLVVHRSSIQSIEDLVGLLIAQLGLQGLDATYQVQGNAEGLATITRARDAKPAPSPFGSASGEGSAVELLERAANRQDISLAMKWELFGTSRWERACGGAPLLSFGRDPYDRVEASLAPTPGLKEAFRTARSDLPIPRSVLDWPESFAACRPDHLLTTG